MRAGVVTLFPGEALLNIYGFKAYTLDIVPKSSLKAQLAETLEDPRSANRECTIEMGQHSKFWPVENVS